MRARFARGCRGSWTVDSFFPDIVVRVVAHEVNVVVAILLVLDQSASDSIDALVRHYRKMSNFLPEKPKFRQLNVRRSHSKGANPSSWSLKAEM